MRSEFPDRAVIARPAAIRGSGAGPDEGVRTSVLAAEASLRRPPAGSGSGCLAARGLLEQGPSRASVIYRLNYCFQSRKYAELCCGRGRTLLMSVWPNLTGTAAWAKKSGCAASLAGSAAPSFLRLWGTTPRRCQGAELRAGHGTAPRSCGMAGPRRHRLSYPTTSACCSSPCCTRVMIGPAGSGSGSRTRGRPGHRTPARPVPRRPGSHMAQRSGSGRPWRLTGPAAVPGRAARSRRTGRLTAGPMTGPMRAAPVRLPSAVPATRPPLGWPAVRALGPPAA